MLEGARAAHRSGAVVSFDLNYRGKLWDRQGGRERAQSVLRAVVSEVDVLVGNEEDIQEGLGLRGPEVERSSSLDPSAYLAMIDRLVEKFPRIRVVATTLREVHSANRHSWSALAWMDGRSCVAPTMELDVYDRVGGGDAFASGFFFGLLSELDLEEALRVGWAHGALVTSYPGDTTMATVDQVRDLSRGASARIQR